MKHYNGLVFEELGCYAFALLRLTLPNAITRIYLKEVKFLVGTAAPFDRATWCKSITKE